MAISERAKEITRWIYDAYGSGTGYLFGIRPGQFVAVSAIVQLALDAPREENDEHYDPGLPAG